MSEQEEAALDGAAPEVVAEDQNTEATEGQETPPAEDDSPEKKSASQERRERRKMHEQRLKEEAEAARRDAATARAKRDRILNSGEQPKEEDFADVVEYAATLGAWKARQMAAQFDIKSIEDDAKAADSIAEKRDQERLKERYDAYDENKAEARTRYADLDAALVVAADPSVVSRELSLMVLESDQAADLAYFLGKNPSVARQLSQMPPQQAAWQLGRIEASITPPKARTETNAPPPISSVKGAGTATKDPDKMSPQEWRTFREKGGKI